MEEQFIPAGLYALTPWYINVSENIMTVQFNHRMLAYLIGLTALFVWFKVRKDHDVSLRIRGHIMLLTILGQGVLGIFTLINVVPIPLAAAHQGGALVALSAVLLVLRRSKA